MHYIRLLRPPSLDGKNHLKLVLTITTDLGDSFLCPDKPIPISVYAHTFQSQDPAQSGEKVRVDDGTISWRAGLRVLKLSMPLTAQAMRQIQSMSGADNGSTRLRIVASRGSPDPPLISDIPFDTEGRILGLSAPFPWVGSEPCYTATREFRYRLDEPTGLVIDEEIGESIDRHVWDAGVVTAGLIVDMCRPGDESRWRKTPVLHDTLQSAKQGQLLNVIELGCGVGILGIGLATALCNRAPADPSSHIDSENGAACESTDNDVPQAAEAESSDELEIGSVLLTDLPDAEEMTRVNIVPYSRHQKPDVHKSLPLDFESLDWEDGKDGVFGPRAGSISWDLIIISDCTYNVDMLLALVKTLSALHGSSLRPEKTGPRVMLATKPRHSSEKALFNLMDGDGWAIVEYAKQPLPVLGMEDEAVEIYLFEKAGRPQADDEPTSVAPGAKRRKMG